MHPVPSNCLICIRNLISCLCSHLWLLLSWVEYNSNRIPPSPELRSVQAQFQVCLGYGGSCHRRCAHSAKATLTARTFRAGQNACLFRARPRRTEAMEIWWRRSGHVLQRREPSPSGDGALSAPVEDAANRQSWNDKAVLKYVRRRDSRQSIFYRK